MWPERHGIPVVRCLTLCWIDITPEALAASARAAAPPPPSDSRDRSATLFTTPGGASLNGVRIALEIRSISAPSIPRSFHDHCALTDRPRSANLSRMMRNRKRLFISSVCPTSTVPHAQNPRDGARWKSVAKISAEALSSSGFTVFDTFIMEAHMSNDSLVSIPSGCFVRRFPTRSINASPPPGSRPRLPSTTPATPPSRVAWSSRSRVTAGSGWLNDIALALANKRPVPQETLDPLTQAARMIEAIKKQVQPSALDAAASALDELQKENPRKNTRRCSVIDDRRKCDGGCGFRRFVAPRIAASIRGSANQSNGCFRRSRRFRCLSVRRGITTFDKKAAPESAAILRQKKALNPPFRRVEVAPTGGLWRLGVRACPLQRTRERSARGRTGIVENGDAFLVLECLPGLTERHLRIEFDRVQ